MTHKLYESIGSKIYLDRVLKDEELEMFREDLKAEDSDFLREIVERGKERKVGIFQRSMIIGKVDFIEPLYLSNEEFLEAGLVMDKRANVKNPVLNLYEEINPEDVIYRGENIFETDIYLFDARFVTDANIDFRNYADNLKKAGFEIY